MEQKNGFAIRERRCITIYKGVTNPTVVYKHETKDIADDIRSILSQIQTVESILHFVIPLTLI
jgi:hypothetical protein